MQGMGAEVIFHGANFDEARLYCEQLAHEHSYRYIHSGNEPLLVAGVATGSLEMLEDEPGLEVIIVPIGGGARPVPASSLTPSILPSV
jgi:threonine dehydratase